VCGSLPEVAYDVGGAGGITERAPQAVQRTGHRHRRQPMSSSFWAELADILADLLRGVLGEQEAIERFRMLSADYEEELTTLMTEPSYLDTHPPSLAS